MQKTLFLFIILFLVPSLYGESALSFPGQNGNLVIHGPLNFTTAKAHTVQFPAGPTWITGMKTGTTSVWYILLKDRSLYQVRFDGEQ